MLTLQVPSPLTFGAPTGPGFVSLPEAVKTFVLWLGLAALGAVGVLLPLAQTIHEETSPFTSQGLGSWVFPGLRLPWSWGPHYPLVELMYLLACQVRDTGGDPCLCCCVCVMSGLCCCVCVMAFKD